VSQEKALKQKHYRHGLMAESVALWLLRLKGYHLLARRCKTPAGEIDLIMRRGKGVVAVEVKYRQSGEPLEVIHSRQQQRIVRALESFLSGHPRFMSYTRQYDVVVLSPWHWPRHIRQAWEGR